MHRQRRRTLTAGAAAALCVAAGVAACAWPAAHTAAGAPPHRDGASAAPVEPSDTLSRPAPSQDAAAGLPPAPAGQPATAPLAGSPPASPSASTRDVVPAGTTTLQAILDVYQTYLYDLSGLDDNLNQAWVAPLAQVATTRLAQATVRQAAAILDAHEHGVGTLRDDKVTVEMTGADTAAVADCQNEKDFYLVSNSSNTPDPALTRADFVGAAQLVRQGGRWYVDVFTTTHTECTY